MAKLLSYQVANMSFSIGIVGLPNVGKSTLFKALTKKQVDASNYPFCTIDPNVGVVEVPDQRLEQLTNISKSEKSTPTTIEFYDIAGLVKNAHKGEGLGNQFLSHIREVDAICHVVRNFHDKNVTHVEGEINPKNDQDVIILELIFADLSSINKQLERLEKEERCGLNKDDEKYLNVLRKTKAGLENETMIFDQKLENKELEPIKHLNLLTAKPMLYVYNIDESEITAPVTNNNENGTHILQISAKIESEIAELSKEEAKTYMQELGLEQSGLDQLITASYKLLNLITFFTSGPTETRAWTVEAGAKAPKAAGRIHTDFEKGFIRAEVINWQEFVNSNGEVGAKEKGLMHLEGKEYAVQDGDVIYFRFAT